MSSTELHPLLFCPVVSPPFNGTRFRAFLLRQMSSTELHPLLLCFVVPPPFKGTCFRAFPQPVKKIFTTLQLKTAMLLFNQAGYFNFSVELFNKYVARQSSGKKVIHVLLLYSSYSFVPLSLRQSRPVSRPNLHKLSKMNESIQTSCKETNNNTYFALLYSDSNMKNKTYLVLQGNTLKF